jgi:tetratricopeptide (TPR) repeat protein
MFGAGNFTAAERLAREALAAEPNISAGHTLLSRALSAQGRAKPSLAAAEAALALFPSAHAFHAQALALRAIRRRRDAVAAAREAVRLAPSRPEHPKMQAQKSAATCLPLPNLNLHFKCEPAWNSITSLSSSTPAARNSPI